MGWFRKRYGEASTKAGFGLILGAMQAYAQGGGTPAVVASVLMGVLGVQAVVTPEKGSDVGAVK
jgi:hypothetical protein